MLLLSHPEMEILFKFITKILMSKESIYFFGLPCIYKLYNVSKEYNLEIATKKTKVFGFVGIDHLRTKIIINDETVEQVSQFTYQGCSISYQFSNDVDLN